MSGAVLLAQAATPTSVPQAVLGGLDGQSVVIIGLIAACAAVAFPIKAVWASWRAGSKGVSKIGN